MLYPICSVNRKSAEDNAGHPARFGLRFPPGRGRINDCNNGFNFQGDCLMAKLIGMSGDFKAREFAIEQGEISIGRKVDNTIVLDHPTISSHHCRILHSGDTCVLQDLDSTNGTRVNSRDVKESALRHKDLIQLGTIEFLFDAPELATSGARYTDADAEVATSVMAAPQDFASISPFGAPPRERRGTWYVVLIITGIVALLAFLFFLGTLMRTA
jgi:hypothetical protein